MGGRHGIQTFAKKGACLTSFPCPRVRYVDIYMEVKSTPFAVVYTPVVWFQRMAWARAVCVYQLNYIHMTSTLRSTTCSSSRICTIFGGSRSSASGSSVGSWRPRLVSDPWFVVSVSTGGERIRYLYSRKSSAKSVTRDHACNKKDGSGDSEGIGDCSHSWTTKRR